MNHNPKNKFCLYNGKYILPPSCICPAQKEESSQEEWVLWKENFLKHLSKWTYYSADDELEKIRMKIREEAYAKGYDDRGAQEKDIHS